MLGTFRNDRDGQSLELPCEVPTMPPWLDEEAKKQWNIIAPWLVSCKVLTRIDQVGFALLCSSISEYVTAKKIVDDEAANGKPKFLTVTDKGNIIQHPALGVANKAHARVVKLLQEFAMLPASRASMKINPSAASNDPLREFGVVG
jgi:P27 family predicted phage terminase small subunit